MARRRGFETVGDMVRSLAVMLAFMGVLLLVNWRPLPPAVKVVDVRPAAARASSLAPYDVLVPTGLGARWRANAARVERAPGGATVWHVGFVTPADQYAGVDQTDGPGGPFVAGLTEKATVTGVVEVAGSQWQRLGPAGRGTRGLVRSEAGVTTLVSGSASYAELSTLAAALRPAAG